MRKTIGVLVVMMALGAGVAQAQDAAAMANQMAMQAAQQANQMAMQASQQASQQAMQQSIDSNFNYAPPAPPPLPMTPRPMIFPGGGKFKGSVQVAIRDADPRAIVFYTTDGSMPTPGSRRYVGPIVVSGASAAKAQVRAMAFDLEKMPSGVVSKTFEVTS
jgi:hypothetical protein